jgi:hypothetical protein
MKVLDLRPQATAPLPQDAFDILFPPPALMDLLFPTKVSPSGLPARR